MSKAKADGKLGSGYDYIKARVSEDRMNVTTVYRVVGNKTEGRQDVELDTATYTDDQIREQVCAELGIDLDKKDAVEILD